MNLSPSPWSVKTNGNTVKSHAVVDANGNNVCSGISPKTDNALLIAASRDLLEACQDALNYINVDLLTEEGPRFRCVEQMADKLKAAIAKAGEKIE